MKTTTDPLPLSRKQLRQQLRNKRRQLSRAQQQQAARQITKRLRAHPVFLRSKHIAFYMADDGEIGAHALIRAAQKMGKRCYLPILHPLGRGTLWFGRYRQGDYLLKNYFGLAEPVVEKSGFPAWALDLVLMPLVGFDRSGNRLGMGGGFYDRTFSFKNKSRSKTPVLMGLAHHCQETDGLTRECWDIPFEYIATDREVLKV